MDPDTLLAGVYLAALGLLGIHGAHRLALLRRFRWPGVRGCEPDRLPTVTVQLPLFDERTVAERLVRAAGALDYASERLEIQVLDDSTDETRGILDREVARLVERGLDARVVRRGTREGFKAGALDFGMRQARGELLCVFDADFLPPPDFLRRLVGTFADPRVGMVQARWGYTNRDESLFTRAQATLLDGHFVIEHKSRFDGSLFFNFNGTAGIWRRECVEQAGGWQHDTLTEDLDLSYRAQLAGWRFVYAADVVAPAELPAAIGAFRSQQQRWAKGSLQVLRKLCPRIVGGAEPRRVKLEALMHLSGHVGYPAVLLIAVLLPLFAAGSAPIPPVWNLTTFALVTVSALAFYETSQRALGRSVAARMTDTLAAIALGIGMCVSQTRAVVEGLWGGVGEFVRTPKRGERPAREGYRPRPAVLPGAELVLAAWFLVGLARALRGGEWASVPFLLLFLWGFTWVGGLTLRERLAPRV